LKVSRHFNYARSRSWVTHIDDGEPEKTEEIRRLERGALRPEELGLTIAEAKGILRLWTIPA